MGTRTLCKSCDRASPDVADTVLRHTDQVAPDRRGGALPHPAAAACGAAAGLPPWRAQSWLFNGKGPKQKRLVCRLADHAGRWSRPVTRRDRVGRVPLHHRRFHHRHWETNQNKISACQAPKRQRHWRAAVAAADKRARRPCPFLAQSPALSLVLCFAGPSVFVPFSSGTQQSPWPRLSQKS